MFRVLSKDDGSKRVNRIKYRKTYNGNIIKVLDEQYIFNMPCGVTTCDRCEVNIRSNLSWMDTQPNEDDQVFNTIYILDDSFVSNQIDLIDHFDTLNNCVVLKSTHENIVNSRMGGTNQSSLVKWNTIQEIIENKDYRHFFYFYNENHESTYFSEQETKAWLYGKSKEFKNKLKAFRVLIFYLTHLEHTLTDGRKIVLLTDANTSSTEMLSDSELKIQ